MLRKVFQNTTMKNGQSLMTRQFEVFQSLHYKANASEVIHILHHLPHLTTIKATTLGHIAQHTAMQTLSDVLTCLSTSEHARKI